MDDKAVALLKRFDELKHERSTYEHFWQEIRELVRPGTSDFQKQFYPGDVRTDRIYDGTAPQALMELSGALHSFMTSPAERWFALDTDPSTTDPESLAWLEAVADLIFHEYSKSESSFNSSMQEAYQDIAAFGTCIVNQEYVDGIRFRSMALADCFLSEDSDGLIDGVYRKVKLNLRQLRQQFGDESLPREVKESKEENQKRDVAHMVFPRTDRVAGKLNSQSMPFASYWVLCKPAMVLRESGFQALPYHVGRWDKLAMETYGRGPAIQCLPDIKMLNRMEFTNIKAAQKAADPPLTVPNDGFLAPIKTSPGSINMMEPGGGEIQALPTSDKLMIALEYTEQKRAFIRSCFFADWVKLVPKKERQTAYEISELVEQQLRMMAPYTGRINTELHGPMIERSFDLLSEHGRLPAPPAQLQGQKLKVVYISTSAQAQKGQKAVAMGRFLQDLIPLFQINPEIMDAVDFDAYAQNFALARMTPRGILRTPEQIASIRSKREEDQQLAAVTENLEPASKAVKNLADAQKAAAFGL